MRQSKPANSARVSFAGFTDLAGPISFLRVSYVPFINYERRSLIMAQKEAPRQPLKLIQSCRRCVSREVEANDADRVALARTDDELQMFRAAVERNCCCMDDQDILADR